MRNGLPTVVIQPLFALQRSASRHKSIMYLGKPLRRKVLAAALQDLSSARVQTSASQKHENEPSTKTQSLRILIAEDNAVNQRVICRMLEKLGHRVVVAADGNEALAATLREPFDLVFMDVQMPLLDGLQATRRIRENEYGSRLQTRIVALTANAFEEDRQLCLAAGMDSFLAKPVALASLRKEIADYLAALAPESPRGGGSVPVQNS